ncbi:proline rich transmembrane protein 1B-like [Dysidea avara]|uniref:proline rich transmembrane protein 1B-like n=1 Tax=Dysidea avara TaxID=196820 RepID=UPI00331724C4
MEDPKQPLMGAPPPYNPSAPPPYTGGYAPAPSSHTTVVTTGPPVITATTVVIRPRTYIVFSIISIIWLFPILGIVALIYSLKVDSEWAAGRYDEAYAASRMARNLNLIALFSHVAVWVVLVIVIVALSA